MSDKFPAFVPMTGIYEPSAIHQLPDGRFLVAEDEAGHPLSLVTIGKSGAVTATALKPGILHMFSDFWKLDDLEGIAADRAGFLYAVTSHSRDDAGEEKKSRNKLVRFRIEGNNLVDRKVVDGLKRAMTALHPVLAAAAKVRDVKAGGGLNIEALEFSPDQTLMLGFRSPLQGKHAIIASVENAAAMFDTGEKPRVSDRLELLDLGGNGIRGLCHVPSLNGYLVIGGPVSREGDFGLWFWGGQTGDAARPIAVAGLQGFERAEGVCAALIEGQERIVVVSDDGNRKERSPAQFLILDPAQLQIAD